MDEGTSDVSGVRVVCNWERISSGMFDDDGSVRKFRTEPSLPIPTSVERRIRGPSSHDFLSFSWKNLPSMREFSTKFRQRRPPAVTVTRTPFSSSKRSSSARLVLLTFRPIVPSRRTLLRSLEIRVVTPIVTLTVTLNSHAFWHPFPS